MATITTGDYLTIQTDDNNSDIELSRWVCDKIENILIIRDAFGQVVFKTSEPVIIDGSEVSDLSVMRSSIGSNW